MNLTYEEMIEYLNFIFVHEDTNIYLFADNPIWFTQSSIHDKYKNIYDEYVIFLDNTKFGSEQKMTTTIMDNCLNKTNDNGIKLYILFLYNLTLNTTDSMKNISYTFEEQIYLLKFSWIYHHSDLFEHIFEQLDSCIQSYIINILPIEKIDILLNFGYPLNISSYLSDIGYLNAINYYTLITYLDLNHTSYSKILYELPYFFNPFISYDKNIYLQNIIINEHHFLINIKHFYETQYFYNIDKLNLINIIKLYINTTKNGLQDIIHVFAKNKPIINILLNHSNDQTICNILCLMFQKNYKFFLKHTFIKKKIKNKIIKSINDNVYINEIFWFNKYFKSFTHKFQNYLINKFNKLNLLEDFVSINPKNVIINLFTFEKIKKYMKYINFNLTNKMVNYMINSGNYSQIYACIDYGKDIIIHTLQKKINYMLNNSNRCWHNSKIISNCLNLLKSIDYHKYNNYILFNIEKICNHIQNNEIIDIFLKQNLIDVNKSSEEIYSNLLKYYGKYDITKVIGKLNLSYDKLANIYKLRFKGRQSTNWIKNILKYKHKLNDEDIDRLL